MYLRTSFDTPVSKNAPKHSKEVQLVSRSRLASKELQDVNYNGMEDTIIPIEDSILVAMEGKNKDPFVEGVYDIWAIQAVEKSLRNSLTKF
jgi:hypothetical protein